MPQQPAHTHEWGTAINRPRLGAILRRVRRARDLAQIDLAAAAGVQRSTISAIENSQRSVNMETLMRLFDILGVEMCIRDSDTREPSIAADHEVASRRDADHDA